MLRRIATIGGSHHGQNLVSVRFVFRELNDVTSPQPPQDRQIKAALQSTWPPPVAAKPAKPQAQLSHTTHPKANSSQPIHSKTNRPQASGKPNQQTAGASNADALKLRHLEEVQAMYAIPIYKRALWLTSDAIVLTLASPFFAAWWIARAIKRITEPK